ncbi:MAG: porin [Filomicrobium sp.]
MKARHLAALTLIACAPLPALAADLGTNCCADLEERIAELEATTARKGNRKVSLTVSGHLHSAVMYWDDGREDNVYVVGNDAYDQTSLHFDGNARIDKDWSAGFLLTLRLNSSLAGEVSQSDDDVAGDPITLWEAFWFLDHKTLGRVSIGQASRASDGVPETDLSGSQPAAYPGIQSLGGGLSLRRTDGTLTGLTYGDLYNHFNGDTANLIRYETQSIAGFTFVATYGEDDIWDTAINYEGSHAGFEFAGAIAYSQLTDRGGLFGDDEALDSQVIVGSAGLLHKPTGLSALVSAGQQSFDEAVTDADGQLRTPEDARFIYAKLGLTTRLSSLGSTSFYGEFGYFKNYASAGTDADTVASLAAAGICATPGNCRLAGTQSEVWGLGFAQNIDQAAMTIYLGYRYHDTETDLADTQDNRLAGQPIDNLQTLVFGTLIEF